jgi:hypothetical protein
MKLPRHSTVVAYLALFTALGGTSYAAIKLPANSVGSRELRANSVGSSEIKARSIQPSDMALAARLTKSNKAFSRAVTDVVLDPNTQSVVDALAGAVQGAPGVPGTQGSDGATGTAGVQGVPGVSGYTIRDAYSNNVAAFEVGAAVAQCADGEHVISGGSRFESTDSTAVLMDSYPTDDAHSSRWTATYENGTQGTSPSPGKIHVWAVCAKVS